MGYAEIEKGQTAYRIQVSLNLEQSYYQDRNCQNLGELKAAYLEKISALGLDVKKFKEDRFATASYIAPNTTFLYYLTTDKEELSQVIDLKFTGANAYTVERQTAIGDAQYEQLVKNALQDAAGKAKKMAAIMGRTLGSVKNIKHRLDVRERWENHNRTGDVLHMDVIYTLE